MIWIILEKTDFDIEWLTDLLETTTIPVIKPALPVWAASCVKKQKRCEKTGHSELP